LLHGAELGTQVSAFLFAFFWGIAVLLSWVGWGVILNRLLFPGHRADWSLRAVWGVSLLVFLGGILNYARKVSPASILLLMGLGILALLLDLWLARASFFESLRLWHRDLNADRFLTAAILILAALFLLRYGASVASPLERQPSFSAFNAHDDFQAYMVFGNKMLQTGSLDPEPYSERGISASLGSQWFLHGFVLSMLSEGNLHLIDQGLALWIILGLLLGLFRDRGAPRWMSVWVLFFALLIPPPFMNVSALLMGLALLLGLYRTFVWSALANHLFIPRAVVVALLASAACAAKSNMIPMCVLAFLLIYLFYIARAERRGEAVREFVMASLLTGVFLLPWMLSMYRAAGTLLYPILGEGNHGSAYGTFLHSGAGLTPTEWLRLILNKLAFPPITALVGLITFAMWMSRKDPGWRDARLPFQLGLLLSSFLLLSVFRDHWFLRYTFAGIFAALFVGVAEVLIASSKEIGNRVSSGAVVAALSMGMVWGSQWNDSYRMYRGVVRRVQYGVQGKELTPREWIEQYRKMQHAVPEGETMLTRLEYPFLLDFRRNQVYIADWPGGASPPPGMPFTGSEALAEYLVTQSVRYVAYSYAKEAGFSTKILGHRPELAEHPRALSERQHAHVFQDYLSSLAQTRKRIYDDGDIFVLDLHQRVEPAPSGQK
jgi:hypothetical protein